MRMTDNQWADGAIGSDLNLDRHDATTVEYYELEKLIRLVEDLGHNPERLKSMQNALEKVNHIMYLDKDID